jgi:hypothetical protein
MNQEQVGASRSSRDLEQELWEVYEDVRDFDDPVVRAGMRMQALGLLVKIRSAGDRVKPQEDKREDLALSLARERVNGKVMR